MKRTPTISAKEYANRRAQLLHMTGEKSLTIIPSASLKTRSRDTEYIFRQNSDFLYFTGFNEPDAVAVFIPNREHGEFIIFCRERNPEQEQWVGRRAGLDGAKADYGADDAFPITDIDEILPGLLENCESVYYNMGHKQSFDTQVMGWVNRVKAKVRSGAHAPQEFRSLSLISDDMRLYKSKTEIRVMKHAAKTSVAAHERAMKTCKPGMGENQLEAEFWHEFRTNDMEPAYTSIVGGGENACILHYIDNNQPLQDGDLVLIDAGAEYNGYASDITRTFPVNGKYSTEQKALYDIVLEAQLAAIAECKPGNTWNDPHEAAVKIITQGLVDLGLLSGEIDQLIEDEAYKPFYMHKTGHWLGIDVHDVGDYKVDDHWRLLEPNMVMTVEPGIYVSPSDKIDEKWWNIGIRIEDDVLITKDGNEVLTAKLCKTTDEIEALMQS